jgi:hypothetical protein
VRDCAQQQTKSTVELAIPFFESAPGTKLLCDTALQVVHVPDKKWSPFDKSGRFIR